MQGEILIVCKTAT